MLINSCTTLIALRGVRGTTADILIFLDFIFESTSFRVWFLRQLPLVNVVILICYYHYVLYYTSDIFEPKNKRILR